MNKNKELRNDFPAMFEKLIQELFGMMLNLKLILTRFKAILIISQSDSIEKSIKEELLNA